MKICILDTETTGVRPGIDRIVDIAAIVVDGDASQTLLDERFNPGVPMPVGATAVNGYTDEFLRKQPALSVAACVALVDSLSDADAPVYVHNVEFDLAMLSSEFERVGCSEDVVGRLKGLPWSCTLKMARELWPGLENNLTAVADRLCVEKGKVHTAVGDVETLWRCIDQIVHRYAHRGHKGQLVKATTAVAAISVADSPEVLAIAREKAAGLAVRVQDAKAWGAAFTCDDDDDERNGHDALGRVKKLAAEGDALRKGVVEPIKAITAGVDELFREAIAKPCDAVRVAVENKLGAYARVKLQRQRDAEAAARRVLEAAQAKAALEAAAEQKAAAARRAESEAAELAARRSGDTAAAEQAAAAQAAADKLEAEQEAARQQELGAARTAVVLAAPVDAAIKSGAATGGYKTRWVASITDPAKVPDVYWRPDLALVQRAVDEGARTVAGCAIVEELIVSNRRRG